MIQDKSVRGRRRKETHRAEATDSNAAWTDSEVPDIKVIYAQGRPYQLTANELMAAF